MIKFDKSLEAIVKRDRRWHGVFFGMNHACADRRNLLNMLKEAAPIVAAHHTMTNHKDCWDGFKPGLNPCWACRMQGVKRGS